MKTIETINEKYNTSKKKKNQKSRFYIDRQIGKDSINKQGTKPNLQIMYVMFFSRN